MVCPIREQSADERQYNTAVLLDRAGQVAGLYRKVFVFWGEGLNLGQEGVKVFDIDCGRIALLTCFDLNFDELWQEAERQGAEIVFWPARTAADFRFQATPWFTTIMWSPGNGNVIALTAVKSSRPTYLFHASQSPRWTWTARLCIRISTKTRLRGCCVSMRPMWLWSGNSRWRRGGSSRLSDRG